MGKPTTDLPELPGVLAELAAAVDLAAALALARWRGGVVIYIPYSLPEGHEMTLQIGRRAAQWLVDNYRGDYIKVPAARDYERLLRDAEIRRKHFHEKISGHALAMEYGLTASTIWRILAADEESADTRQQKLL